MTLDLADTGLAVAEPPALDFPDGPFVRDAGELQSHGLREEIAMGLADARVFRADYDLLRHDFPELRPPALAARNPSLVLLDGHARDQAERTLIDAWLIEHAAYISQCQAAQSEVNTPIEVTSRRTLAYRPLKYGRALVYSLRNNRGDGATSGMPRDAGGAAECGPAECGLLDVKGTGCAPDATPAFGTHRNGLLKLSDAFIEWLNQRLIRGAFRHGGTAYDTVPIYAIIDPGIDIKERSPGGMLIDRAALLVRRAHLRQERSGGLAPYGSARQIVQLEAELYLRRYGISSCNPVTRVSMWKEGGAIKFRYGHTMITFCTPEQLQKLARAAGYREGIAHFDGVNVQHVREVGMHPCRTQLIDFGTYRVHRNFENTVLSLVSDRLLRWGGTIRPDSARYTQPDPAICVPYELWGADGSTHGYPGAAGQTRQDTLCEGLAADYRTGALGRDEVCAILDAFLDTATHRW